LAKILGMSYCPKDMLEWLESGSNSNIVIFKIIFFFFGGMEVWTQGLTLARQALFHSSHASSAKITIFENQKGQNLDPVSCP
jgi:hypothetical protein